MTRLKRQLILISIILPTTLFAQEVPQVLLKDSSQLKLSSLSIEVNIIGNFASVTYDMQFFNELDRTLEGELAFPLGEGQDVSEFAMEINGKLRKAVVVEKELARRAYENTVRQNIDPALLEKTQGNNYKARVYPILPKANKRIVLTYEQELPVDNNSQVFELPLGIQQKLEHFSVRYNIKGSNGIPEATKSKYKGLKFKATNKAYEAAFSQKNLTPSAPIVIKIPVSEGRTNTLNYKDYFYVNIPLEANSRIKAKPKKITILWDASYSQRMRQKDKELQLLDQYLDYLQNVDIQLISFSNAIQSNLNFEVKDGNWSQLKTVLNKITYDGGTCYDLFSVLTIKSDEILLFSDGISNLGQFASINNSPVYTICSVSSANYEDLNNIASSSGGQCINLNRLDSNKAFELLNRETYQFLGIKENNAVSEVYPKHTNISTSFSIAGRFSEATNLTLLLGYSGKVTKEVSVPLNYRHNSILVKRLWAKQKLQHLNKDKDENKESIIELGKQYKLVSDYTSMLILDRIEDYVRYRIEPPQELKEEYKSRIKNIKEHEATRLDELKDRKEELFEDYQLIHQWYLGKWTKKGLKTVQNNDSDSIENPTIASNNTPINQVAQTETPSSRVPVAPPTSRRGLDRNKRIITGTVVGSDGLGLPGVSVYIKGTTNGTISDVNGDYALNADQDDELVFSFVGFQAQNQVVGDNNEVNISLNEDACQMDEVVVVAYGTTRQQSLTGSIATVVSEQLMGQASGVQIVEDNNASPSVNYNTAVNQPLYIVDGVITTGNPIGSMDAEDIDALEVLKPESASKLYGSRASNGLIIITTKKGIANNAEAINELNKKIADKIELKSWNPDSPYIDTLRNEPNLELAYQKYLQIRDNYSNSPSFYLDVADLFDKEGNAQKAIMILSNLAELKLDNHELMRALAYKLEYFEQYKLAVYIYKQVLKLRPEEPQSYRDLALAYEQVGEIQKSYALLHKIYNGELLEKDMDERFYGIEQIAYIELTRLLNKYPELLATNKLKPSDFTKKPVDIRVVIDWNHNDTDIDLWVIDPTGEKAYYKNTDTKIGGRMSEDFTEGYGPEEFMLKKAIGGSYKILVDYYTDNLQKISGPTILKATIFTDYGREHEQKKTLIFRLDKDEEEIELGQLEF